jgi:DNA polymerase-1
MSTLLLIDGNPIMHRAYHALPLLTAKDKTPTNVIYGFFSMLHKAVTEFSPDYISTVFDTPKPTFRHQIFVQYQIQRPKIDDKFKIQIPLVKQALDYAGIFRIEKDGYEADDIIGTIINKFNSSKLRIIIITGDRDLFQLIKKNIYIVVPQVGLTKIKIYDEQEIINKIGIAPEKITDFKALVGDQSDNYPGAKGIGPKTAIKLINQFGTIEEIYKNLDAIKDSKLKEILKNEKENVFLSKKLATIETNINLDIDINQLKFNGFNQKLADFFDQYQIYSLKKRFFENKNFINQSEEKKEKLNEEENIKQIKMF